MLSDRMEIPKNYIALDKRKVSSQTETSAKNFGKKQRAVEKTAPFTKVADSDHISLSSLLHCFPPDHMT